MYIYLIYDPVSSKLLYSEEASERYFQQKKNKSELKGYP